MKDVVDGDRIEIAATKPIAKGEEVYISYDYDLNTMTKRQRAGLLKANWGFTCTCSACSLSPEQERVSDQRRREINLVSEGLAGFEPHDYSFLEELGNANPEQARKLRTTVRTPFRHSLSAEQAMRYHFRHAQLLEAEGLLSGAVIVAYLEAMKQAVGIVQKSRSEVVLLEPIKLTLECLKQWRRLANVLNRPEDHEALDLNEKYFKSLGPVPFAMSLVSSLRGLCSAIR